MTYDIANTKEENGEVKEVILHASRDDLRQIQHDLQAVIEKVNSVGYTKQIREDSWSPVIKTDDGNKVYLKYEDGKVSVSLSLAGADVRRAVLKELGVNKAKASGSMEGANKESPERIQRKGDRKDMATFPDKLSHGERFVMAEGNKTTFVPEFTKEEADYMSEDEWNSGGQSPSCKDCSNYIEGGGCHLVQGEIEPDAVCDSFYSDATLFIEVQSFGADLRLAKWGEKFQEAAERLDVSSIVEPIKTKLNQRLGR